jgi:UDP-N-acetylglucosamine transferase subunit ALG13
MKICLASSGGGHLRQLLSIEQVYANRDHFFVVSRSALSESVARSRRCFFVDDTALGKLTRSPKAWWSLAANLANSLWVLAKERPDVILSTGAGAALCTLLMGRLFGCKVVFLETFAHSRTPSLTGRLVSPLAHAHLVQWESLKAMFPRAVVVSPLVETGDFVPDQPEKPRQTFLTVGTHGPFDRLVRATEHLIERAILPLPVIAQVGKGGYQSPAMQAFESCDSAEMKRLLGESNLVITHAGTGSILSALEAGCKVIAIARSSAYGEHYDDHQQEILDELVARNAILGGKDPAELEELLEKASSFHPQRIEISPEPIVREIQRLLDDWFAEGE